MVSDHTVYRRDVSFRSVYDRGKLDVGYLIRYKSLSEMAEKISVDTENEIWQLVEAFNKMAESSNEREKAR